MRRRARTTDVEEEEEEERGGGEVEDNVTCQEKAAERRAAIGDHNQAHNRGEPSERSADRAGSDGGGTRDFRALMLDEQIVKGLEEAGYIRPSPVQLRAIPLGNVRQLEMRLGALTMLSDGVGSDRSGQVRNRQDLRVRCHHPPVPLVEPQRRSSACACAHARVGLPNSRRDPLSGSIHVRSEEREQ